MARISPRSSIQALMVLTCLLSLLLLGCSADYSDPVLGQEIHTRYRRATVNQTVNVANSVPENVANDVMLYNLTGNHPGRQFSIEGNSAGVFGMFEVRPDGRLTLARTLPATTRRLFDYETFKTFDIIVRATNATDATDVTLLTIRLTLTDVNDEPPVFTNEPRPFYAKLQSLMDPGSVVYRITVADPDQNPSLTYGITSVTPNEDPPRFQVNSGASTGSEFTVVTVGTDAFSGEYTIGIYVEDSAAVENRPQRTTYEIRARVGNIPPQFYSSSYQGRIYENIGAASNRNWVNTASNGPLEIKVKQFQTGSLTYRLLDTSDGQTSSLFEMVPDTTNPAIRKIQNIANIDYEKLKSVQLTIEAREAGTGLISSAQIAVEVVDENDHTPEFLRSQYSITNLPEDTAAGQSVLMVEAADADSGQNGELVFTLTNYNYFNISTVKSGNVYQGILKANGGLDYDKSPGPRYNATVIVSDKGTSPKSATMMVFVEVVNVNDNDPVFINSTSPVRLVETASNGVFVTRIQATDIDGDTIKYYFQGKVPNYEIFAIDQREGTVTLNSATGIPPGKDMYTLPVIAVDDDNCCKNINRGQRTATTTLTINIIGVNANKPKFTNCASYDTTARVKEKSPLGTQVIQVKADDPDRGEDGRVLYRIVTPDPNALNAPFQIDEDNGNITVKGTVLHGPEGYIQVTVVGRNPGNFPLLEGWCTFRVNIIDINDHAPVFAQSQYDATVSILTKPVSLIRQMQATDDDVGPNANITYSLLGNDSATQIFNINATTGLILLVRDLNPTTPTYSLTVVANDNGIDPGPETGTTTVIITVNFENTQPPEWVNLPSPLQFSVSESAPIGHVITTLRCDSKTSNPEVEYRVFNATDDITSDSAYFNAQGYIRSGQSFVNLTVKAPLSSSQPYRLSLVCQTLGAVAIPSLINPVINVQDANNQVPAFQGLGSNGRYQGQVAEDALPGQSVLTVTATDSDKVSPFNVVHFELDGPNKDFFQVSPLGGNKAEIQTTSLLVLDRENTSYYNVKIKAMDGAPANPPNPDDPTAPNTAERYIDITVTDVNDNVPVFEKQLYTASVSEKAFVNSLVFVVTATDKDETDQGLGLSYRFGAGNVNNAFTILAGTGEVRVARNLDYENPAEPKIYTMILTATDSPPQSHTATTTVRITVLDENDNRPVFSQGEYRVEGVITEEDTTITPSNPRFLVQVNATDADKDRTETDIRYSIVDASGQPGPGQLFTIEPVSGNVSLIGVLDREAGPSPNYKITVQAADERINPLISYADVVIVPIDINDNKPEFNQEFLKGSIDEEKVPAYVVTLLAEDKDAGENARVSYRISPTQPSPDYSASFSVAETGAITTRGDPSLLDREKVEQMFLRVEAYDHGNPALSSFATVTITLNDINDQSPYFEKTLYSQSMSEAQTSGVVMSVPVIDMDSDPKNKQLKFELRGTNANTQNFDVRTNGQNAEIYVVSEIDYETDPHFYTFDLYVTDGVAGHENTTRIEITVTDFNDNAPVFDVDEIKVTMLEERPRGTYVANFSATDADSGINAEFEFSVLRSSDPRYEFYIHPQTGVVTTRRPLDREIEGVITVTFMAKDKGEIPLNSTARLIVTLTDINDNAPQFAKDYLPVIPENENLNGREVVEIFAVDPDTPKYGPPFGFKLADGCTDPACTLFALRFNPGGDNSRGTATISVATSVPFDREARKYYYLPIVMQDMYGVTSNVTAATATNTLTIVIGDKNDNEHESGHQDIHVYNYEGQFGVLEIGRVYAKDPDDWDLPDKTFTFIGPDSMRPFFKVDPDTGMITVNLTAGLGPNANSAPYEFKVNVRDATIDKTVTCTIAVTVEELTDEAVRRSGGVRLQGITAEEFIKPDTSSTASGTPTSKYTRFRQQVATLLGYPSMDNVQIISLTNGDGYLDVRFSGHASPYLNGAQMESSIMLSLEKFEKAVGIKVSQVPINLCMEELYDDGCYTNLDVTGQPAVINSNGTSVVSVGTSVTAKSGCVDSMFPEPVECQGDYCFNGGTCIKDDWGKLSCQCPAGFDGPRCQQRRHSFDGTSSSFYKGLSVCSEGRTSIDFITQEQDGLIMFSGPVTAIDPNNDPSDYLILELEKGYPKLRINLGSQELQLTITGKDMSGSTRLPPLSDGRWHHLDIDRHNQDVILTVDHCGAAMADANGTVPDWSPCRASGRIGGPDVLLNVQSLLQLGGRYPSSPPAYPAGVTNLGFKGCLKNLVHNTKLYDLHFKRPPAWNSGSNGCPREASICGEGTDQPVCGQYSICESQWQPQQTTCQCMPGYYGVNCDKEAPIHDLKQSSYLKWQLSPALIDDAMRTVSLQMIFRTRQTSGTLFALTNTDQKNILIQLKGGKLTLAYNMGEGGKQLTLNNALANNGIWHLVQVERYGNEFTLSLDGGEGRNYNYQTTVTTLGVLFELSPYMSAGAYVPAVADTATQVTDDLVNTCLQDVRFNGHWLPLTSAESSQPEAGAPLTYSQNVVDDCERNSCATVTCSGDLECFNLWEDYECRCPAGTVQQGASTCVSACLNYPCFNGGVCSIVNGEPVCTCKAGWTGPICVLAVVEDTDDAGLHPGAIAGIVIGLLLLIILIVVIIVLCMRGERGDKEKMVVEVDPDDDFIRENVMFYDEEGAGEEDHDAYDITLLQRPGMETSGRPTMPSREEEMRRGNAPRTERTDGPRLDRPDVGSFIKDRIRDTEDDDPNGDSTRAFNFEGDNSEAGSLSSLNTSSSGGSQDYDYLSDWGPKFAKLADMYGAGQNLETES